MSGAPQAKPFRDRHGQEIREFAVLKCFHFIGARRKRHFMYKWARTVDGHLVAMHLTNADPGNHVDFRAIADPKTGVIPDVEIVQDYTDQPPAHRGGTQAAINPNTKGAQQP
jgi:hypothetical protein